MPPRPSRRVTSKWRRRLPTSGSSAPASRATTERSPTSIVASRAGPVRSPSLSDIAPEDSAPSTRRCLISSPGSFGIDVCAQRAGRTPHGIPVARKRRGIRLPAPVRVEAAVVPAGAGHGRRGLWRLPRPQGTRPSDGTGQRRHGGRGEGRGGEEAGGGEAGRGGGGEDRGGCRPRRPGQERGGEVQRAGGAEGDLQPAP